MSLRIIALILLCSLAGVTGAHTMEPRLPVKLDEADAGLPKPSTNAAETPDRDDTPGSPAVTEPWPVLDLGLCDS